MRKQFFLGVLVDHDDGAAFFDVFTIEEAAFFRSQPLDIEVLFTDALQLGSDGNVLPCQCS